MLFLNNEDNLSDSNSDISGNRENVGAIKPFSFFSSIGGKDTSVKLLIPTYNLQKGDMILKPNASRRMLSPTIQGEIALYTNANVDKNEKLNMSRPTTTRAHIGNPLHPSNSNNNILSFEPLTSSRRQQPQSAITSSVLKQNRIIIGKPNLEMLNNNEITLNRPNTASG